MKHLTQEAVAGGNAELEKLLLGVPPDRLRVIWDYLDEILDENTRVNLTAVTRPADAVHIHVVDSLAAYPELSVAPEGTLVDIGTGGGFPGVPLAIASGRYATLLDSVGRKGQAVERALRRSHADERIRVVTARAEEHARSNPAAYAVAVARAVAPLPSLVELASPLLQAGGHLIAMKAVLSEEELVAGDAVASLTGMQRVGLRRFKLPKGGESRSMVIYRRSGTPEVSLPRRNGLAQKRPLA